MSNHAERLESLPPEIAERMKHVSAEADAMTIDEVIQEARQGVNAQFWLSEASRKLHNYRLVMPVLAQHTPGLDWQAKADKWHQDLKRLGV